MKKLLSFILAFAMVLGMTACGDTRDTVGGSQETAIDSVAESSSEESDSSENQTDADGTEDSGQGGAPEGSGTIVVTGMDAAGEPVEVTVPYKPERVVVLDLANLDILDNLGLGGCVVGAPTITLPYLQSYNDELPIVGSVKTPDLEAVMACEPDLILMGGRMAEYMDSLGEIAPVLRLTTVSDEGLVEAIRANAQTVGAIFGETEHVDEMLAQYDAQIAALAEFAQGKTCVLGMSTSGSFNLLGNDGRCSLIVNEIGFDNIGVDAAAAGSDSGRSGGHGSRDEGNEEESSGRSGSGEGSEGEGSSESGNDASGSAGVTLTHGNEVSFEAIVALNPDYIFVMDRDSAISATGAQLAQEIMENELVMKTDAYRNGNLVILENPGIWYLAEGGITSLGIMLSDLEKALLD
ncbi:siderophore ABC transporter substrate-binding protein [Acetatifactor aquisgranensis]|uniref:siderophore ABC transporter substrate-binding protein n=1 Tax=Acetatifactor aquisgranensis TaxID=2941233 RepID=UPI00203A8DF8|nr:ABC transporter substrate-binding protein [Acetatifactor aquisgranensis]